MKRPYIKRQYRQSWLMGLTGNVMTYFALGLAGCTVTYMVAVAFNFYPVAEVIVVGLELFLVRSLVLLGCLWAIAVINESIR